MCEGYAYDTLLLDHCGLTVRAGIRPGHTQCSVQQCVVSCLQVNPKPYKIPWNPTLKRIWIEVLVSKPKK
jgi:hypothetical protein